MPLLSSFDKYINTYKNKIKIWFRGKRSEISMDSMMIRVSLGFLVGLFYLPLTKAISIEIPPLLNAFINIIALIALSFIAAFFAPIIRNKISQWFDKTISDGIIVSVITVTIIYIAIALIVLQDLIAILLSGPTTTADTEELRNLLLGIAAFISAPFLIWRTTIADQQVKINRERHYTDLFITGAKNLGAVVGEKREPDRAARIGAIYALERLTTDSQRDYWPIMETLTAFVRENAPLKEDQKEDQKKDPEKDPKEDQKASSKQTTLPIEIQAVLTTFKKEDQKALSKQTTPPIDIQATLTVIGRRSEKNIQYDTR